MPSPRTRLIDSVHLRAHYASEWDDNDGPECVYQRSRSRACLLRYTWNLRLARFRFQVR